MRGPKPAAIELSDAERQGLEALLRRHSAPQQLVLRARIVLAMAAGRNNAQIVRDFAVDIGTARRWRGRWLGLQAIGLADLSIEERLTDAPRSGKPTGISAAQTCQIVARGILPTISPRHAARLLKKGTSSRTSSATG